MRETAYYYKQSSSNKRCIIYDLRNTPITYPIGHVIVVPIRLFGVHHKYNDIFFSKDRKWGYINNILLKLLDYSPAKEGYYAEIVGYK